MERMTTAQPEAAEYQRKHEAHVAPTGNQRKSDPIWNTVALVGAIVFIASFLMGMALEAYAQANPAAGIGRIGAIFTAGGVVAGLLIAAIGAIGSHYRGETIQYRWWSWIGVAATLTFIGLLLIISGNSFGWLLILIAIGVGAARWMVRHNTIDSATQYVRSRSGPGRFALSGVRRDNGEEQAIIIDASSAAHAKAKGEQQGLIVAKVKRV